ncbi:MAG: endonuclease MutS2 [Suipraeoptans sp.]
MNQKLYKSIQFEEIKNEIADYTLGKKSREMLLKREPSSNLSMVKKRLMETQESVFIQNSGQHVPFIGVKNITSLTDKIQKSGILEPSELIEYADFLRGTRQIKKFFEKNAYNAEILNQYASSLQNFAEIEDSIYSAITSGSINDDYTKSLKKIRNSIVKLETDINESAQKFLRNPSNRTYLQENLVIKKNNRYTVPIKAEFKNKVKGNVIENSSKGTTVFIELSTVSKYMENLLIKQSEEMAEIYQILANLTGMIYERLPEIALSIDTITELDVIFARAKYSISINGRMPQVNNEERMVLNHAKHPLLGKQAVPLDINLGIDYRTIVITGANAGGKTVVLKTVALLTILTMYGILIPCEDGTEIAIFDDVFIDIGDNQSLENSLSTFSAHMCNLKEIITGSKRNTLVLLDEIGSGTDPKEGAAIGIAAMEEMYKNGSIIMATTHYGEIKEYAINHEDFTTAAMEFDRETLTPFYKLKQGETGESAALLVARRMGLQSSVISSAKSIMKNKEYGTSKVNFVKLISENKVTKERKRFSKGDRVHVSDEAEEGLFYELSDENVGIVFISGGMKEISLKRIKLVTEATKLYPIGYDLESLFEDFSVRKKRKDLERGSKKAHKLLNKEISSRKIR